MAEKMDGLRPLKQVIAEVKAERAGNKDVIIRDPDKVKVEVVDKTQVGYGLNLNGEVVPFDMDGVNSLCKWLKMDFRYFAKFPRKLEFIEHIQALLPNLMRANAGALIRMSKEGTIRGFLPGKYTILDDEQVLGLLGELAYQSIRNLRGVLSPSTKDNSSLYRLVFGESALNRDEIYPSVTIRHSEVGGKLSVQFGTLRVRCLNGSIDTTKMGSILNWGHRGSFDNCVQKVGDALRVVGDRVAPMLEALRLAQDKVLERPGEELSRLLRAGWIGGAFHDSARACLTEQLRAGEKFGAQSGSSKYGVFNAMTEAAKGYRPREQARCEEIAHRYLLLK